MKKIIVTCTGCKQQKPLTGYIGDEPYCKLCRKKVKPLVAIMAMVSDSECADCCLDGRVVFHCEFLTYGQELDRYDLCLDCLTNRLEGMAEGDEEEDT